MPEEQARSWIAAQLSIEETRRRAFYVIDNSADLESIRRQVAAVWARITALRDGRRGALIRASGTVPRVGLR